MDRAAPSLGQLFMVNHKLHWWTEVAGLALFGVCLVALVMIACWPK